MPSGRALLLHAARELEELVREVVFLGGTVTEILITDRAAQPVRMTLDVDVLLVALTRSAYHAFCEALRGKGFREASDENVICRWRKGALVLDVMPTDPAILGFGNPWYADAAKNAAVMTLDGVEVRVITAPYFLATKFAAYQGRGEGDLLASRDMEDFLAVVDGRPELIAEIAASPEPVRRYLAESARDLLDHQDCPMLVAGCLGSDDGAGRRRIVLDRLARIAGVDEPS